MLLRFLLVAVVALVCDASSQSDGNAAFVKGSSLMASNDYSGALREFNKAISGGLVNKNVYYKRGIVQVILGSSSKAIADFTKVLGLSPDDWSALRYRGEQYAKDGRLEEALADYTRLAAGTDAPADKELLETAQRVIKGTERIKEAISADEAIGILDLIIDFSSRAVEYRKMRAQVYKMKGQPEMAIGEYQRIAGIDNQGGAAYIDIAELQYEEGEVKDAVKTVAKCLEMNPEHTICKPKYQTFKKMSRAITAAEKKANKGDIAGAVDGYKAALKIKAPGKIIANNNLAMCKLEFDLDKYKDAVASCTAALKVLPDMIDALLARAKANLELDEFDAAIRDYQEILKDDDNHPQAKEGMQTAQTRKKAAGRRDYYKILGLKRNANNKEIKNAYRKAVKQYHPDAVRTSSPEEQAEAEKIFRDINDAKEVLEDPEKRASFDRGIDPLDASEQHGGGGGNPFGDGFPFGGGGGFGGFQFRQGGGRRRPGGDFRF